MNRSYSASIVTQTIASPADSKRDSLPLWQQLQAAAVVLQSVRTGTSTTVALDRVASVLRPGVQALVFHVLRSLGRAEALRKLLANRAPPPAADALLCTAIALAWRDEDAPYEIFTLVNQSVEAAKRAPATQAQASFVNACLRRFLRERSALIAATDSDPVAHWNHPAWWVARLKKDHPTRWQTILTANNGHAPMTLRVNAQKSSRADYLSVLQTAGIAAWPSDVAGSSTAMGTGITLAQPRPVHELPGFADGVVSVQDAAAQLAAPLLLNGFNASRPLNVLDACAAPGGKTAHLLELGNCQVTALDIDAVRCERIHQTLQRLDLTARVAVGDASHPEAWWDGTLFDAVLLDAPCTASGIVRRHPDVRWLRRADDIARLADIQARLLKTLWPLVKPGGRLLYCTCSVFRAEGVDQIQTFLAHNTNAALLPSPGHLMPHFRANGDAVPDNSQDDHDGFYLALLEKRAA
jgi:16S rRNA (cytosine967-C5)-methyltransferase